AIRQAVRGLLLCRSVAVLSVAVVLVPFRCLLRSAMVARILGGFAGLAFNRRRVLEQLGQFQVMTGGGEKCVSISQFILVSKARAELFSGLVKQGRFRFPVGAASLAQGTIALVVSGPCGTQFIAGGSRVLIAALRVAEMLKLIKGRC